MKRFGNIRASLLPILILLFMIGTVTSCTTPPETAEKVETVIDKTEAETNEETAAEPKVSMGESIMAAYTGNTYPGRNVEREDDFNLNRVSEIRVISAVTGEYSLNQTETRFAVGGTDLGVMFNDENQLYIAFGDTFAKEDMRGYWRSNVLAITEDSNPLDGLYIDRMITPSNQPNTARQIIPSKKIDNIEKTTIPTGGIVLGDDIYISYMSVNHWGTHGDWVCNFGGVVKSSDQGESWKLLTKLRWPGDSNFCQMVPVLHDEYVYVWGITGGRHGRASMMRVPSDQYEDFDAYEYLIDVTEDGNPVWEKGTEAMQRKYAVLRNPVGEMSVMYSEYLEEWIVTYLSGPDLVITTAKNPWGPYSRTKLLVSHNDFPGLYGAFMSPFLQTDPENPDKIYFLMSLWKPVYNVLLMEATLEKR